MPQPYIEYRSEMNRLISEMEKDTPQDPEDVNVLEYRRRIADLKARRVMDLSAVIGEELNDNKIFELGLDEYCCPVCGLSVYHCYAGGVHSYACDRLLEEGRFDVETCEQEDCEVCGRAA